MDEPERNQPPADIPGGPTRPSTLAGRKGLPEVARRERVTAMLRVHDLDEARQVIAGLSEADEAIVRQIAREGAIAGAEPVLRYKAISVLGGRQSTENLNLPTWRGSARISTCAGTRFWPWARRGSSRTSPS